METRNGAEPIAPHAHLPSASERTPLTDPKVDEAKGRVKEAAGSLTDDKKLKNEGKADRATSSVKEKVDHAVDAVRDKFPGGGKK